MKSNMKSLKLNKKTLKSLDKKELLKSEAAKVASGGLSTIIPVSYAYC